MTSLQIGEGTEGEAWRSQSTTQQWMIKRLLQHRGTNVLLHEAQRVCERSPNINANPDA